LPALVREFEAFKSGATTTLPDVPFQMLTSFPIERRGWAHIARRVSWQTLRMNLNTFARHGVFEEPGMTDLVASRLRDEAEIGAARPLPYQILGSHRAIDQGVPRDVADALEDAMELTIRQMPSVGGRVIVCPDVSGSMQSPITGYRRGATTV